MFQHFACVTKILQEQVKKSNEAPKSMELIDSSNNYIEEES